MRSLYDKTIVGLVCFRSFAKISSYAMVRTLALVFLLPLLAVANPSVQSPSELLPLHFETDPAYQDRYLVLGAGYKMSIGSTETLFVDGSVKLRTRLVGARRLARLEGLEPLDCRINYIHGGSASEWRDGVKGYRSVRTSDAYAGIDVMF